MKIADVINGHVVYMNVWAARHPVDKNLIIYALKANGETIRKSCSLNDFVEKLKEGALGFSTKLSDDVKNLNLTPVLSVTTKE